ncbi:hypothetical protein [Streptomyces huasconensis]|uniref:hypothetical protein n=1 Tax=Streptomyces huasconensis TaxID=1854574 RepID=UPI00340E14BC
MGGVWVVGLVAAALLVAVIAVVEKAGNRPARQPGKSAPSASRRGEDGSWVTGGAVAGCGGGDARPERATGQGLVVRRQLVLVR